MENHGRALGPGPNHQVAADGVATVGQQNLGPEPIERLCGEFQEERRFTRTGRPLRPAEACGQQRDPYAVELEVKHFGLSATAECGCGSGRGPLDRGQNIFERRFVLVVEHAARECPAVPAARGEKLEQLTCCECRAAGWVEVAVDRSEQ